MQKKNYIEAKGIETNQEISGDKTEEKKGMKKEREREMAWKKGKNCEYSFHFSHCSCFHDCCYSDFICNENNVKLCTRWIRERARKNVSLISTHRHTFFDSFYIYAFCFRFSSWCGTTDFISHLCAIFSAPFCLSPSLSLSVLFGCLFVHSFVRTSFPSNYRFL